MQDWTQIVRHLRRSHSSPRSQLALAGWGPLLCRMQGMKGDGRSQTILQLLRTPAGKDACKRTW